MLRRKVLSLVTVLTSVLASGLAFAQDATTPPPAAPPAAEPAPATPPPPAAQPSDVVVGEQPAAAAPGGDQEKTEEIVVTGTRIRRKDLTTPAPVTVINRDQISASGKVRIGDFLQALPEQGNAINTQFNNGGDGATRVGLRGLRPERTLVLLNGRRIVPGGTGADASVDLNSIPSNAIERIEILKDGASAVYGSDAIAGVVNLITRKNFDGANAAAYAGTSNENDGQIYDVSLSAGTNGDRGSLMFSAGYSQQYPIWAGDRGWSATPLQFNYQGNDDDFPVGSATFAGSGSTPQGQFFLDPATCTNAFCQQVFADNGGTGADSYTFDPSFGVSHYRAFTPADAYNFQPDNYLVTPNERIQLFALGDTRLGDVARGYFEASYVNRQSKQTLAPEPLVAISPDLTVSQFNIYNPFQQDLPAAFRRLTEFGRRTFEQDLDTFRVVTGVDGTLGEPFGPLSGWFWDVNFNYGRTQGVSTTVGTLRSPLVQDAIGPSFDPTPGSPKSGDEVCVRLGATETPSATSQVIPGCVPLDILGGVGSITPAMVGGLGFAGTDRGNNQLASVQLNTSGDLVRLFADRPIALAAGYEYRDVRGQFIPNPITAAFENTGNNTSPAEGSYHSNEIYGELTVPLVSNLPFAQDIEAALAARWVDYSTFGTDTTYKAGLRWRIIPDVTVRGTFSTAFRAPSISDLYSGNFESFESVSDPCADLDPTDPADQVIIANCGAAAGPAGTGNGDNRDQLPDIQGGNPNVQPETADIWTAGIVWEPRFVKNFSATVDYYNIKVDNAIDTIGPSTILNGCYGQGNQTYCGLITRSPGNQFISQILDTTTNVGGTDTAGIDVALRYALPTGLGRFGFVFDGTWLQKYDQTLATGDVIDARGNYDLSGPPTSLFPEVKFNTGITWGLKGWGAGFATRYIGAFRECSASDGTSVGGTCFDEDQRLADGISPGEVPFVRSRHVSAYAVTDLFGSYALRSGAGRTVLSVGVNNLFDQAPRTIYAASPSFAMSDPTAYDYVGRFWWVRVEHTY